MPAPTAETLSGALGPLMADPSRAAVLLDVDGTLAPIVRRAEDAQVPQRVSRLLSLLSRSYGCVACISGRSAAEARRLVGVGSIAYAGTHGAELLEPRASVARLAPAFGPWLGQVRNFAEAQEVSDIRLLRIRVEDKGAIVAYHWRGADDQEAAETRLRALARDAERAGLGTHWGRMVLEVRPPVSFHKGQAVHELVGRSGVRTALYAGDDTTDLDAFDALDALEEEGALRHVVRVGVRSSEGPPAIVRRADLAVDGPAQVTDVLAALLEAA